MVTKDLVCICIRGNRPLCASISIKRYSRNEILVIIERSRRRGIAIKGGGEAERKTIDSEEIRITSR